MSPALTGFINELIDNFGESDLLDLFDTLLPWALLLTVPNLSSLWSLCYGWGFTQSEAEEAIGVIVMSLALDPLTAAFFLENNFRSATTTPACGPSLPGGEWGFTAENSIENCKSKPSIPSGEGWPAGRGGGRGAKKS